jgi:hypothetical protein
MIQDRRHMAHDVSEAMFSDRQKRNEDRRCPRKYCDLEFRAIETHPED